MHTITLREMEQIEKDLGKLRKELDEISTYRLRDNSDFARRLMKVKKDVDRCEQELKVQKSRIFFLLN